MNDAATNDGVVLVVNSGGVTLELTVVDANGDTHEHWYLDPWDGATDELEDLPEQIAGTIAAVGHRIVHGGDVVAETTLIDDAVVELLQACATMAPLHQQRSLAAVQALRPVVTAPHVACLDTTFHSTIGAAANTYAIPAEWRQRWPLRRFGFHGFSHAHVSEVAGHIAARPDARRIISCHLASGSSLCAIDDGRSVDTTMGMTPTDGLVMATRSGSVDPGLILWLLRHGGLDADEVARGLDEHGGLAALSGGSGDMREVLAGRDRGDRQAQLAFEVYTHRLRREIGAMAAALGGVDVIAFTGGVGQNLADVRAAAIDGLAHLGVGIDANTNRDATGDTNISASDATAATVVVATDEHTGIARATRQVALP